jgi:hypothetical protein
MECSARAVDSIGLAVRCMCGLFVVALEHQSPIRAQSLPVEQSAPMVQLEEIYIARSVPDSRNAPTSFCARVRTGIGDPAREDRYTFRSTSTRSADGRMVDANINTIGDLHACFADTSDPGVARFYAEGTLGGVTFKGTGECHNRRDRPEKGLVVSRCFLELSSLPAQFAGGLLTTNSMNSQNSLGMETNPGGYTQASIATIRLWRRR